ncbi:uncharacterized protein LOC34620050 [Cyclospora cayetanensis]|uniref:Uncharacterized protein LOC34620050 n=1 Tax=Cyclospora cayetanensis TaxID=88456 RepID=A0A6P6RW36_9EIME|nr:uncharacterized protein LOC34620050 [Cyclospora cayetanensis]
MGNSHSETASPLSSSDSQVGELDAHDYDASADPDATAAASLPNAPLHQQPHQFPENEFFDVCSDFEDTPASPHGPPPRSQRSHERSPWHSTSSLASLPQETALRLAETAATAAVAAVAAATQAHGLFGARPEAPPCCHYKRYRCLGSGIGSSISSSHVCPLGMRRKKRRLLQQLQKQQRQQEETQTSARDACPSSGEAVASDSDSAVGVAGAVDARRFKRSCCALWLHAPCSTALASFWGERLLCVICRFLLADPSTEVVWISTVVPLSLAAASPSATSLGTQETAAETIFGREEALLPASSLLAVASGHGSRNSGLREDVRVFSAAPPVAAVEGTAPAGAAAAPRKILRLWIHSSAARSECRLRGSPLKPSQPSEASREASDRAAAPSAAPAEALASKDNLRRMHDKLLVTLHIDDQTPMFRVPLSAFPTGSPYTISVSEELSDCTRSKQQAVVEEPLQKTVLLAVAATRQLSESQILKAIQMLRTLHPSRGRAYLQCVFEREEKQQLRLQQRSNKGQIGTRLTQLPASTSSSKVPLSSAAHLGIEDATSPFKRFSIASAGTPRVERTVAAEAAAAATVAQSASAEEFSLRLRCLSLAEEGTSRQMLLPARSVWCMHASCFDLESFLSTAFRGRQVCGEKSSSGVVGRHESPETSSVFSAEISESWRCPLCAAPALPHELYVCGFVLQLLEQHPKDTASVVFADAELLLPVPHRTLKKRRGASLL